MKEVALITGASSGIGKEFAYIHAKEEKDIVLVARREERLNRIKEDLENKYKVSVKVIAVDLSLPESPLKIYKELKDSGIEIEYLINNAGFGGRGVFCERDMKSDVDMINVNILALTKLTKLFLPDFVNKNRGKILNVSSTASFFPGPLQSVYFATKAYVTYFSNAISEELRKTGVTVTVLLPGATETEFAKVSDMEKTKLFNKVADVRKVALDGYYAMMQGKLEVVSGLDFVSKVLLKVIPFMPKKLILKQVYKMQKI